MKHIMLDLETLNTTPDAAIVAIGAVSFSQAEGIESTFYRTIDLESAMKNGSISAATLRWWLQQETDARMELVRGKDGLFQAVSAFSDWFSVVRASSEGLTVNVWGNGAGFDNVILRETYGKLNMQTPWGFWEDRCYRTIKNTYCDVPQERIGTPHNALDDARTQAVHLLQIAERHSLVFG